jgi:hypothetical protein
MEALWGGFRGFLTSISTLFSASKELMEELLNGLFGELFKGFG